MLFFRVNAVTLLISIISLGNSENRNEINRAEYIFDLIDFNRNAKVTYDELVRSFFSLLSYFICHGIGLSSAFSRVLFLLSSYSYLSHIFLFARQFCCFVLDHHILLF
jgi:hypothetical protein